LRHQPDLERIGQLFPLLQFAEIGFAPGQDYQLPVQDGVFGLDLPIQAGKFRISPGDVLQATVLQADLIALFKQDATGAVPSSRGWLPGCILNNLSKRLSWSPPGQE
jgi:hypothetical protein